MVMPLILASGSEIREQLLRQAAVDFEVQRPRVDEKMIRTSLVAEGGKSRDIADALAEAKARKVAAKFPEAMVIGCDQVLDFKGTILSKPTSKSEAIEHLTMMRGEQHSLLSAAVIYYEAKSIWRHVGHVRLRMCQATDAYIAEYVDRNWTSIQNSVGAYKLEEEGIRLFHSIEGDYFHVLGMPLLELLAFLSLRGVIKS